MGLDITMISLQLFTDHLQLNNMIKQKIMLSEGSTKINSNRNHMISSDPNLSIIGLIIETFIQSNAVKNI